MDLTQYKKLLSQYVAFKSVSTDKQFRGQIAQVVTWLKQLLAKSGFKVEVWKGKTTNPVVFASYVQSSKLETVLVYGHYDVQPAEKSDGWKSDPFKLTEEKGRLVGRGVVDNKGQNLIHILTVLQLIKQRRLKYNVKFLIEGNEETANPELAGLMKKNKKKLSTDYVLVSDGEVVADTPTIEVSLRGGFNLTLTYRTGKTNLHSGLYGGAVPNAAHELSRFLGGLFNDKNQVVVPNFYEGVDKAPAELVRSNKRILRINKNLLKHAGVKRLMTEEGLDFYTQTGLRPTVQVTGFKSGYIGEGYANIVPSMAEARINFRLVASQEPQAILEHFKRHVKKNTPAHVDYDINVRGIHRPVKIDIRSEKVREVKGLLKSAHKKEVLTKCVGGAIPFVADVKEVLGLDTILVSMGNDDCNMHGVNENFKIDLIQKGLRFSEMFFGR